MRHRLFSFISFLVIRHPWKITGASLFLTILSIFFALSHLALDADYDNLVSEKLDYHQRYKSFLREFGDQEYLYVVVEAEGDPQRARDFLDQLGARLTTIPDIQEIAWKITDPALEKGFLLYLSEDEIKEVGDFLSETPFSLRHMAAWKGLDSFFAAIAGTLPSMTTQSETFLARGFTLLSEMMDMMQETLGKNEIKTGIFDTFLLRQAENFDPKGYLRNGDLFFLLMMPQKDFSTMSVIEKPLEEIRKTIDLTRNEFPGIKAGLTGRPVLAAYELMATNRDMNLATGLAILGVGILFILFFRSFTRPLLATLSLSMGIAWTFGAVALFWGELTILSLVFALILVGAANEYALQYVGRYEEEFEI